MKKRTLRFLALALMAAMAVSLFTGCGPSNPSNSSGSSNGGGGIPNPESQNGVIQGEAATGMVDKIVVQATAAAEDPSPFAPSTGGLSKLLLYGRLIYRNEYGAMLDNCSMWLAKSVTKVDDYTYDIELYDYITDSKGNNIDADDVIFSYQMSFEVGKFLRIGSSMESLVKTGDYSLRMTLNTAAPGVAEDLMSNSQLDIVDKEWYENASEEERRTDPAVTGPYRMVSQVVGSSLVIEAVEDYWQKDASLNPPCAYQNVKTIEYKVISEPSMRAIALENHEIDVAMFQDAANLPHFYDGDQVKAGYNVAQTARSVTTDIFLNLSESSVLANNIDLRKAVLYALNSEDIMYAAGFDQNTSSVLKTLGSSAMAGAQPEWENEDYYDYDPKAAAEYLKAAGYAPGEIKLTFMASPFWANDSVCAVVMNNLEEAGFKAEVLSIDTALFNTYRSDPTQWDLLIDMKGAATGHIAGCWDICFNPSSFTDGTSSCLNRDDELVKLLNAVNTKPTAENLNAFHYYLKDQAYCKGLYATGLAYVSTDKILELKLNPIGNVMPNALVFAADYQSGT